MTKQTVDHNLINFETQSAAASEVDKGSETASNAAAGGGGDLSGLIIGGEAVQFEDDDFIFEEFTRMRLKGANAEDVEA